MGEGIAGGSKGGVPAVAFVTCCTRWSRKTSLSEKVTMDGALKDGRGSLS